MVTNNDPATASRSPDHAPDRVPRTRTCGRQSPAPEKASRETRAFQLSWAMDPKIIALRGKRREEKRRRGLEKPLLGKAASLLLAG